MSEMQARLGLDRPDRCGEPGQPIDTDDEHITDAAIREVSADRGPELRALSVLDPDAENVLDAVHILADSDMSSLVRHESDIRRSEARAKSSSSWWLTPSAIRMTCVTCSRPNLEIAARVRGCRSISTGIAIAASLYSTRARASAVSVFSGRCSVAMAKWSGTCPSGKKCQSDALPQRTEGGLDDGNARDEDPLRPQTLPKQLRLTMGGGGAMHIGEGAGDNALSS
jgi:hypothetical protein